MNAESARRRTAGGTSATTVRPIRTLVLPVARDHVTPSAWFDPGSRAVARSTTLWPAPGSVARGPPQGMLASNDCTSCRATRSGANHVRVGFASGSCAGGQV